VHILTVREARASLNQAMDDVCRDHEPTAIVRRRGQHVVLLSLEDFNSMNESMYLLGSASNASRLRKSIAQLRAGAVMSKSEFLDSSDDTATE